MATKNRKPIKRRISDLEDTTPEGGDHEYKMILSWEEDDELTEAYYKDGKPITRSQWLRESGSGTPSYQVNWGDDDGD